jgi:hypothetical protein
MALSKWQPMFLPDTEDVYHFFNDDIILTTNELLYEGDGSLASNSYKFQKKQQEIRRAKRKRHHQSMCGENSHFEVGNSNYDIYAEHGSIYDYIFDNFTDLYASNQSLIRLKPARERKIRRALGRFAKKHTFAIAYKYRKQSEFLRVCYSQALYNEKITRDEADVEEDDERDENVIEILNRIAMDIAVPPLFPRRWPQLAYRSPLEWKGNPGQVVSFLNGLALLPELGLFYEPLDTDRFFGEAHKVLKYYNFDFRYVKIWKMYQTY